MTTGFYEFDVIAALISHKPKSTALTPLRVGVLLLNRYMTTNYSVNNSTALQSIIPKNVSHFEALMA